MRIFFITNNYTPYTGGVTNSIIAITNALLAEEHEVFVITLDFLGNDNKIQMQKDKPRTEPDIALATTGAIRLFCPIRFMYKKNYIAIPWRPTHAIKKLIEQYNPDIIHVQHPFLLGVSGLKAAQTYNIPCVFTYHTMYEDYAHYIPLPQWLTKPIIRSITKRFCNSVDGIIAPSSAIKNYLMAQQIKTPITIIPSPLRPFFLTATAQTSSHKQYFELLIVTRFVPEKNVPFVFDVLKQLPDNFTLTLVGYGSDYEILQQLAYEQFRFSPERVRFIHKPNQDDLLACYRNADLFIFPSTTDTQGIVLAESMSQGVPIIAIDGPGQRDIIKNGYNGFIVEDSHQATETIIKIANDKALHATLIAGARATANNYHASAVIKKLLAFYHTIISCYHR